MRIKCVLRFLRPLVSVPDCEPRGFIPGDETIISGKNSSEIQSGQGTVLAFTSYPTDDGGNLFPRKMDGGIQRKDPKVQSRVSHLILCASASLCLCVKEQLLKKIPGIKSQ
jgi:hypothetical protein